jgi:hypothetical protein
MDMVNGRECMDGWAQQLADAQWETHYPLLGALTERLRFSVTGTPGDQQADHKDVICHDCVAAVGQLHVPGCDVERCPLVWRAAAELRLRGVPREGRRRLTEPRRCGEVVERDGLQTR